MLNINSRKGEVLNMDIQIDFEPTCRMCGNNYPAPRWSLGYKTCLPCGEKASAGVRRTVVPLHKSNYMMVTDMDDLKGINNKGGLVK